MLVTYTHAARLMTSIRNAATDALDCDGCFELISEFADAELRGNDLLLPLQAVQIHLKQCPCCKYEYETLLEAIQAANDGSSNG